jgi:hypothetical protein
MEKCPGFALAENEFCTYARFKCILSTWLKAITGYACLFEINPLAISRLSAIVREQY